MASDTATAAVPIAIALEETGIGPALREIHALVSREAALPKGTFPPNSTQLQYPLYGSNGSYLRFQYSPHVSRNGYARGRLRIEIIYGDGTLLYVHEVTVTEIDTNE